MPVNRVQKHLDCSPEWELEPKSQGFAKLYHPEVDDPMAPFEAPPFLTSNKSLWSVVEELRQSEVERLESRIESLEHAAIACRGVIYPIDSILPGVLSVKKTIHAQVVFEDDCFIARFPDANINASGDSELCAIEMLRDSIATSYLAFCENEHRLGKEPERQLAVLREFIVRSEPKWEVTHLLKKLLKRHSKS